VPHRVRGRLPLPLRRRPLPGGEEERGRSTSLSPTSGLGCFGVEGDAPPRRRFRARRSRHRAIGRTGERRESFRRVSMHLRVLATLSPSRAAHHGAWHLPLRPCGYIRPRDPRRFRLSAGALTTTAAVGTSMLPRPRATLWLDGAAHHVGGHHPSSQPRECNPPHGLRRCRPELAAPAVATSREGRRTELRNATSWLFSQGTAATLSNAVFWTEM
jgi:hypothetical protein